MMEIRNPAFMAAGRIDCEVMHPLFGWIPFTADPEDVVQMGRAIYAYCIELGPAPYTAPKPEDGRS